MTILTGLSGNPTGDSEATGAMIRISLFGILGAGVKLKLNQVEKSETGALVLAFDLFQKNWGNPKHREFTIKYAVFPQPRKARNTQKSF